MPIKPNSLQKKQNSQSGNALIMILIAVALLAALTFTLTKSEKDRGNTASSATLKVQVINLTKTFVNIENAIHRLRNENGCSENEIDFDELTGLIDNPISRADGTCHIFTSEGGKVPIPNATTWGADNWGITGGMDVVNLSSDANELIIHLLNVPENLCDAYNTYHKIEGDRVAENAIHTPTWNGLFGDNSGDKTIGDEWTVLEGKKTACYHTNSQVRIYYALIPR